MYQQPLLSSKQSLSRLPQKHKEGFLKPSTLSRMTEALNDDLQGMLDEAFCGYKKIQNFRMIYQIMKNLVGHIV